MGTDTEFFIGENKKTIWCLSPQFPLNTPNQAVCRNTGAAPNICETDVIGQCDLPNLSFFVARLMQVPRFESEGYG
jgi:hypothetical protein